MTSIQHGGYISHFNSILYRWKRWKGGDELFNSISFFLVHSKNMIIISHSKRRLYEPGQDIEARHTNSSPTFDVGVSAVLYYWDYSAVISSLKQRRRSYSSFYCCKRFALLSTTLLYITTVLVTNIAVA